MTSLLPSPPRCKRPAPSIPTPRTFSGLPMIPLGDDLPTKNIPIVPICAYGEFCAVNKDRKKLGYCRTVVNVILSQGFCKYLIVVSSILA